jgi:putative lipoic acid-binding regulatory protein
MVYPIILVGGGINYQVPKTGDAYIVMFYYNQNGNNYMQVKLNDSLKKGKKYYGEYYVSLLNTLRKGCNNIAMLFTKNAVYVDTNSVTYPSLLQANPQIISYGNPIVTDTMGWVKISGIFTAQGGEQYLTLGNFKLASQTQFKQIAPFGTGYNGAAYYVDDVAVYNLDSFNLKADAGRDTTITVGDSVFVGSYTNGLDTLQWQNQNTSTVINTQAPGFWVKPLTHTCYVLTQTVNGYTSSDTVCVTVNPLPLTMVNYQLLMVNEKQVMNKWQTANETNVSHYQIQRSTNSGNFETIGTVAAKNFASNEYSFVDELKVKDQLHKTLYYRIVGVDKDGKKTYSIIKQITIQPQTQNKVFIFPNPAKDYINIVGKDIKEIKLLNTLGQVIQQVSVKNEQAKLDVKDLSKGMYMLNIVTTKGGIINEKIIIQ